MADQINTNAIPMELRVDNATIFTDGGTRDITEFINHEFKTRANALIAERELWKAQALRLELILTEVREIAADIFLLKQRIG